MKETICSLMPKSISLHLHSLLRMITLFIFSPSIEICILHKICLVQQIFIVMETVIMMGCAAAQLPRHNLIWGGENGLLGLWVVGHIAITAARRACVSFLTAVVIPIVREWEKLWILKHYIPCLYLSEFINYQCQDLENLVC